VVRPEDAGIGAAPENMAKAAVVRDLQEWEWIPRRFDPTRALALPRSVAALIGTNPRVIADDVWAKLLWAGLNLQAQDLPGTSAGSYYPLALIRALALAWLFSGLRSDELSRLRVGCIRRQHDGRPITADSREVLAEQAVCLLDVPVHKTGTAFTKPVDPIVGQVIEAWQAQRPIQPKRLDRKTNLQRMLANIPLTEDERAAVDDGQAALDSLLTRLVDVPTPTGPTPRQIDLPATATLLPITDVRHGKSAGR
jgi:integrase